jgi:hypothetical protein
LLVAKKVEKREITIPKNEVKKKIAKRKTQFIGQTLKLKPKTLTERAVIP